MIIGQGKPLVISKSDVERFRKKDIADYSKESSKPITQFDTLIYESNSLLKWHMKIISNVFAYSSVDIKLLGYDKEIEKLINLISIFQTTGLADVKEFKMSKSWDNLKKQYICKLMVVISKTIKFDGEYLSEGKYCQMKKMLNNRNFKFSENIENKKVIEI